MASVLTAVPSVGTFITPRVTRLIPSAFDLTYSSAISQPGSPTAGEFITYDAEATTRRMTPVFVELDDREEQAKRIGNWGERPSPFATADRLSTLSLSEDDKSLADAVKASVLTAFWDESLAQVRSTMTANSDGFFEVTTLEEELDPLLDHKKVLLVAATLGVSAEDYKDVVVATLADEVREKNFIYASAIQNPYARYQTVRINDPVLTVGGKFLGTIDDFKRLHNSFCRSAPTYWEKVESGFINRTDYVSLAAWNVLARKGPIFTVSPGRPSEIVARQCSDADAGIQDRDRHVAMVEQIAYWSAYFFFAGWPPEAQNDPTEDDQKGKWVARYAAAQLGFGDDMVQAHLFTYRGYVNPILNGMLFDKQSIAAILHPNEKIESWEGVEFAERAGKIFAPLIGKRISSLYWADPMGSFMGGLSVINPAQPKPPGIKYRITTLDDYSVGPHILTQLYERAGRQQSLAQEELADWRSSWLTGVESYTANVYGTAREDFDDYWKEYSFLVTGFGAAQENAKAVISLKDLLGKFNRLLGYRDLDRHYTGQLVLPQDSRVVVTGASVGEFVPQGAPLVTVQDTFRRRAQATLTAKQLGDFNLHVGAVAYNDVPASPLTVAARIATITLNDRGSFDVNLSLEIVVRTSALGVDPQGLGSYLPMSNRFCLPQYLLLDDTVCEKASGQLPEYGGLDVIFPN